MDQAQQEKQRIVEGSLDHVLGFLNEWTKAQNTSRDSVYRVMHVKSEGCLAWWYWGLQDLTTLGIALGWGGGIRAQELPGGERCKLTFSLHSPKPEYKSAFRELIESITAEMQELGFLVGEGQDPQRDESRDSGHWAYPPEKRIEIVEHFWRDRDAGKVMSKAAWARTKYGICGKTLRKYEKEYEASLAEA